MGAKLLGKLITKPVLSSSVCVGWDLWSSRDFAPLPCLVHAALSC